MDDPLLPPPPGEEESSDQSNDSGSNPFLARAQRFGVKSQTPTKLDSSDSGPSDTTVSTPSSSSSKYKSPKRFGSTKKEEKETTTEAEPTDDEQPKSNPYKSNPYSSGNSNPYSRGGPTDDNPVVVQPLVNPYQPKEEDEPTPQLSNKSVASKLAELNLKSSSKQSVYSPPPEDELPPPPGNESQQLTDVSPPEEDDFLPPPPSHQPSTSKPVSKSTVSTPQKSTTVSSTKPTPTVKQSPASYLPDVQPEGAEDDQEETERKQRNIEKIKRQQMQYHQAILTGSPLPSGSNVGSTPNYGTPTKNNGQQDQEKLPADDGKGPWCANCGGTLKNQQVMEVNGKEYHPRCFVCFQCKKPLTGQLLTVQGKYYHPVCLSCKHCNTNLQGKQFVVNPQNNQVYCPEHARLKSTIPGSGLQQCAGCTLSLSGADGIVNALNEKWHKHCFVCEHCREPLEGRQCIVQKGKPYCEKDHDLLFRTRCVACSKVIDGQILEIGSDNSTVSYHPACFKCVTCDKALKGSPFYLKGNSVFCEAHAT